MTFSLTQEKSGPVEKAEEETVVLGPRNTIRLIKEVEGDKVILGVEKGVEVRF